MEIHKYEAVYPDGMKKFIIHYYVNAQGHKIPHGLYASYYTSGSNGDVITFHKHRIRIGLARMGSTILI